MARNRFWFEVAPITYAVKKNFQENIDVSRRRYAQVTCKETTARTTHLVRGSGPHSFVIFPNCHRVSMGVHIFWRGARLPDIAEKGETHLRMGFDDCLPP